MLEKYFQNDLDDNILLGIIVTGYSNDIMGMEYIQHFHKMTEKRTKGKFRMLVFDGHGSHLSDRFTWYCWQHDIVPFRLLAHLTHLLQPLDVGIEALASSSFITWLNSVQRSWISLLLIQCSNHCKFTNSQRPLCKGHLLKNEDRILVFFCIDIDLLGQRPDDLSTLHSAVVSTLICSSL